MSLPIIRGASAVMYPYTMTCSFSTLVGQMQNGTQQRTARRACLVRLTLPYDAIKRSAKDSVRSAVTSAFGAYDTTLSITLNGITYPSMSLDTDIFEARQGGALLYSCPLAVSQTITGTLSGGSPGANFPTFANGAVGILPYTQRKRFQTVATVMQAGPKYTTPEFGGGFSGYPSDGLMSWEMEMSKVSDADAATIMAHFLANWGMLYQFQFTDEDGTAYAKAHYAMDDLAMTVSGPNNTAMKISLEATA